jgi:Ca2+/H+ antiporter
VCTLRDCGADATRADVELNVGNVHHAERQSWSRQAWLTALYLVTALVAVVLYRTAHVRLFGAIASGFAISAALVSVAYAVSVRRRR